MAAKRLWHLLQHDSSPHQWWPGEKPQILALTIDDATRFIVGAGFIEAETTFAHLPMSGKFFSPTAFPTTSTPTPSPNSNAPSVASASAIWLPKILSLKARSSVSSASGRNVFPPSSPWSRSLTGRKPTSCSHPTPPKPRLPQHRAYSPPCGREKHLRRKHLLASSTSTGTPRPASRYPSHPGRSESRRDQLPGSTLGNHLRRNQAGDHCPTARKLPSYLPPAHATSPTVARHSR